MLSLPTLQPPLPHTLPFTTPHNQNPLSHTPAFTTQGANNTGHPSHPHHHHGAHVNHPSHPSHPSHPHHHHHHHHAPPSQPPLYPTLHHDERLLLLRKQNIRRFGAGWLRPPGVSKTLQGFEDERMEREEAEALRAREEARLAMEEEGMMEGLEVVEGDGEEGMDGMEGDLDEDVPDADADGLGDGVGLGMDGDLSDEDEGEDGDGDGEGGARGGLWSDSDLEPDTDSERGGGLLFGEQIFGGDEGEGDYAVDAVDAVDAVATQPAAAVGGAQRVITLGGQQGAQRPRMRIPPRTPGAMGTPAGDAMAGVIGYGVGAGFGGAEEAGAGADLDDDVPDAQSGSYEHTDTSLEDESEEEVSWVAQGQGANGQRAGTGRGGLRGLQQAQFRTPSGQAGNVVHDVLQGRGSLSASFTTGGGSFLGESVFGSSPLGDAAVERVERVVSEGSVGVRGSGGRRRGSGRRGRGREN